MPRPRLTKNRELSLLAVATAAPTSGSRFREFEREFWSYVEMTQLERTRG